MKKLLLLSPLLLWCSHALAQANPPNIVNCAPGTPCTLAGPSGTGTGDPGYVAFAKSNINWLGLPAYEAQTTCQMVAINNVAALSGLPFIDNANGVAGYCLLLSHQNTSSQNGPWMMSSGTWSRPAWYSSGSTTQAVAGITIQITVGAQYTGSLWFLSTPGAITIDTTGTTWNRLSPASLANGSSFARSADARGADVANVLDFEGTAGWSGTIRHNYGNTNAVAGISCTATSTTIGLANVTIPSSYSGASAEIPGCGNPGALNSANPGNPTQTFSFTGNGTGYVPQQIVSALLGTSNTAAQAIIYSTTLTALPSIASSGSGCTNGTQTFTGTTGIAGSTGTSYFTVTGTVSGGTLASLSSFVANGPYTAHPPNLAAEPVTGGGCTVPPTINLSAVMGAATGSIYTSGNYTAIPSNPVGFTAASLPISTLTWASAGGGTVTATICSYSPGCAATLPGWMYPGWTTGTSTFPVTISGATPSGYNGTYTATVIGPNGFQYALTSNPGTETVAGTYTVAPSASGATAALSWYGNPLVGTISNIVNSGGNATFTMSIAASSTLTQGGGVAYLWKGTDTAAFTAAIATGAQAIICPSPPTSAGWEGGYMLGSGINLGSIHRWTFDCMGGYISGAVNANSPVVGAMLTVNASGAFREQSVSLITRTEFDAAGGFERNLTMADWDWVVCNDLFKNATALNIAWSYGGHSRESHLCNSVIINDGYAPLTPPVMGIDSEAPDTRIEHINIMQGFQQTAIYNNAATGDVHFQDIHAEDVIGGPIFTEKGSGNHWIDDVADSASPGFPGFSLLAGFDTVNGNDVLLSGTYAGQLGILADVSSLHNVFFGNTPNRGGIPAAYACVDQSNLNTGNSNQWGYNVGCLSIGMPVQLPTYIVSTLPSCSSVNNKGSIAYVSDATSPTYGASLTGGGTVFTPVFCNGSAWSSH